MEGNRLSVGLTTSGQTGATWATRIPAREAAALLGYSRPDPTRQLRPLVRSPYPPQPALLMASGT